MKGQYKLTAPDNMLAEIKLEATVGDFRHLKKALESKDATRLWPLNELYHEIVEVIRAADRVFIAPEVTQ